jgi:hypothetical protein
VKLALKEWAKLAYISLDKEKSQIKSQLEALHEGMEVEDVTSQLHKEESILCHKLHKAFRSEKEMWRLKS